MKKIFALLLLAFSVALTASAQTSWTYASDNLYLVNNSSNTVQWGVGYTIGVATNSAVNAQVNLLPGVIGHITTGRYVQQGVNYDVWFILSGSSTLHNNLTGILTCSTNLYFFTGTLPWNTNGIPNWGGSVNLTGKLVPIVARIKQHDGTIKRGIVGFKKLQ